MRSPTRRTRQFFFPVRVRLLSTAPSSCATRRSASGSAARALQPWTAEVCRASSTSPTAAASRWKASPLSTDIVHSRCATATNPWLQSKRTAAPAMACVAATMRRRAWALARRGRPIYSQLAMPCAHAILPSAQGGAVHLSAGAGDLSLSRSSISGCSSGYVSRGPAARSPSRQPRHSLI